MVKKFIGSAALTPSSDSGFDLDTKGQLHGYTSTQYALDVGTNNFVIYADSTTSSGLAYGASAKSVLTGAQDILYSSAANTLARLAAGTSGDVLTTKGTGSAPTWETPSGGAWTELYNNTLTSTAAEIDTGTITATNFLRVYAYIIQADVQAAKMSWNGSVSSDYSYAYSENGGSYVDAVDSGQVWRNVGDFAEMSLVATIFNKEDEEKTMISTAVEVDSTGSGTAPDVQFMHSKWDITAGQITQITIYRESAARGLLQAGTQLVVLGRD